MRRVYIGKFSHHVRERDIERFFRSEGKIREVLMKDGFAFVEFEHTGDAETAVRRLDGRDLNGDRVHVEFAKGPPKGREGARGGMGMSRGLSRNGPARRDDRYDRGDRGDRGLRGGRDGRDKGDNHGGGRGSGGGISYAEKYGPPRNTEYRVIVENLSSRVSWQDLKDLMRQAGEVTFADAHKRERNMGIVDFASIKDMRHAIETLNDTEFHGRRIKIYEDKGRRRGGGDSGGGRDVGGRRGGRRSRSRSPRRYSSSRSRSRDRTSVSRSRSRSPITRDRDAPSRSRSRSHTRSCDRAEVSRSRSRSPITRDRDAPSRSRSVSSSPGARREPQRSRSRSRSRSRESLKSDKHQSKSPSRSNDSPHSDKHQSRSRSVSRSRSRSPSVLQNN